ncbi:hypothetical protein EPUS_05037 [Endocarpon pusillum Z07020]|uniref:Squalene cyclase C-terminal domain-containing protein n=1 Tax=Endocarpon pusillum (strain Z07020 / HMAS-L-300199) TaxID=1263415 RepID=U1GM21_ENDPU|nr:uncharacterized protein EPUS_05037 [Endocarpon pusillum Z07020]ERF72956.1 hypothetical protein EPUS_05037 [Endocarpon pusillum Z07020]
MALDDLREEALNTLQQAIEYSFEKQKSDGHWTEECVADVTFTCQYVMFKRPERGWLLVSGPNAVGNASTTTEAYLALKILNVPADHPSMLKASAWVRKAGGVEKMPAELILMPPSFFLNIYTLSSWARSTLIPCLIIRHHDPVYALPNGRSADNDFLDELWSNPRNKNIPFASPLSTMLWKGDYIEYGFTLFDNILGLLGGLKHSPNRGLARKKCVDWLIEHQEVQGDWAGFFPPMHGSPWALIEEGYPFDHKAVVLGLDALERLSTTDTRGKRLAPTISPLWDTALMIGAMCDAGVGRDARVQKAINYVKERQLLGPEGDWRIYSRNQQPGGWSFEYFNTWYPDVDDTAVVVMSLIKQDPYFIESERISNAVTWMLGMHNRDGGFAAFDVDNDKLGLHKIPFSDMDSLCDPSTADVTGRVLECFGLLLSHRKGSLDRKLQLRVQLASERAIEFLLAKQEPFGGWWGRWGNNYNYGTSNVLRGLVHFAQDSAKVQHMVDRATRWFESVQNSDGGWGETLVTYERPELAGTGESTPAQTAWGVTALLPYRPASYPAIERGIRWLIANQTDKSLIGATWNQDVYPGTGFPMVLYLNYPYYHHYFPITALAKYLDGTQGLSFKPVELTLRISGSLNRPCVLLMVVGSRGDVQVFLRTAAFLTSSCGYRVRIATHAEHQKLVESRGFEFYCVAGSSAAFAKTLTTKPNILLSTIKGDFGVLRQALILMVCGFWRASIDSNESSDCRKKLSHRPFVADSIVSCNSALTHIHCAQKLQVPLVLVSLQPQLSTSEFPNALIMSEPNYRQVTLGNYISFICLDILNWLALGYHLNYLRVKEYGMPAVSWTWAVFDLVKMGISHFCLWSPHVLPRLAEWDSNVAIAGYAFDEAPNYTPPKALESFLDTDKPVLAISFGSADIPYPVKLMAIVFAAVKRVGAKAVVCRRWSDIDAKIPVPDHIFVIDEIPYAWLLPHVQGFVHHGGAGHIGSFWAAKIQQLGLGPPPLNHRRLTAETLVASLEDLLSGKYRTHCMEMASKIASDKDGAEVVGETVVHTQNSVGKGLYCSIIPELRAPWKHTSLSLPLSGAVAACLVSRNILHWSDLELEPTFDWSDKTAPRSEGIVKVLKVLTQLFAMVTWILYAFLQWIKLRSTEHPEDTFITKKRDPVRQARIRQAHYDLEFINGHDLKMEDGASVEDNEHDESNKVTVRLYNAELPIFAISINLEKSFAPNRGRMSSLVVLGIIGLQLAIYGSGLSFHSSRLGSSTRCSSTHAPMQPP